MQPWIRTKCLTPPARNRGLAVLSPRRHDVTEPSLQGATSPDEKGAAPKDGPKVWEEGFTFGRYG